jgi:hypothetical protein
VAWAREELEIEEFAQKLGGVRPLARVIFLGAETAVNADVSS